MSTAFKHVQAMAFAVAVVSGACVCCWAFAIVLDLVRGGQ